MQTEIWTQGFQLITKTSYPCARCRKGYYEAKKGDITEEETPESIDAKKYDEWEPEWYNGSFAGFLTCSNCKGKTFVAGRSFLEFEPYETDSGKWEPAYVAHLKPKYFTHAPDIIEIPESTDEHIADALRVSFSIYFQDPNAAANKIRVALELFLDQLRIKKTKTNRSGKRVRLNLFERIALTKGKAKQYSDHMQAFRILGNEGSHRESLEAEDVLELYEILENFLQEYYENRTEKIQRLIKKIKKT